jgi:ATP-dependent Clp protease ATP-binding subunit ClpA
MPENPNTYSRRAFQVFTFAEEEARQLGHNYVGQEHVLIGLARVDDGLAAHILAELGATEELIRDAVIDSVGKGTQQQIGTLGHTPRVRKTIELAGDHARKLGHMLIGTEHLLLALLTEGEGQGPLILSRFGITLAEVEESLQRLMAEMARGPQGVKGLESQFSERRRGVRRHSLVLPEDLFQRVQAMASAEQTTVTDLLRRFTRLGLLVMETQGAPDTSIVIRQGEKEQRLLML